MFALREEAGVATVNYRDRVDHTVCGDGAVDYSDRPAEEEPESWRNFRWIDRAAASGEGHVGHNGTATGTVHPVRDRQQYPTFGHRTPVGGLCICALGCVRCLHWKGSPWDSRSCISRSPDGIRRC